jgi:ATP-binding cassette subfamily F protein 3
LSGAARARLYYGNNANYHDRIKADAEQPQEEQSASGRAQDSAITSNEKRILDKQRQAQVRKLEKQEAEILKTLEELEKTKTALEAELALPEVYSNGENTKAVKQKLDETTSMIETKSHEWEEISKIILSTD